MKKNNPYIRITGWAAFLLFLLSFTFLILTVVAANGQGGEEGKTTGAVFLLLSMVTLLIALVCLILSIVFRAVGKKKKGEESGNIVFASTEGNGSVQKESEANSEPGKEENAGKENGEKTDSGNKEKTDLPVFEERGEPDVTFREAFRLYAFSFSTYLWVNLIGSVFSFVPLVLGILFNMTTLWILGILILLLCLLDLFLLFIYSPRAMVKLGKKNKILSVTRIYKDRIAIETFVNGEEASQHVKKIYLWNQTVKAKETEDAFFFAVTNQQKKEGLFLRKKQLNGEAKALLSEKVREYRH